MKNAELLLKNLKEIQSSSERLAQKIIYHDRFDLDRDLFVHHKQPRLIRGEENGSRFQLYWPNLITQECIDARLSEIQMGQKAPLLEMEFDWSMKPALEQIPPNAKVFVDVGKDMSFMRFDYGTFGNPVSPDNVSLSELDSWTSASFVVRVVDGGNLLALVKSILSQSHNLI